MIPIARPSMGEAEAAAAARVIMSGWVTQGPEVAAFEHDFGELTGAAHACAVSSCTTALHLALLGVGVGAGDEVITPSHSYIATANAVRYCGAEPVFADIEPHGFNIDPAAIERAITPRTAALLVVHQVGMPCDMERIMAIARHHELPVVEDAACAAGSRIRRNGEWQPIGRPIGDVVCFSFHPRKVISTGDGGMLTTDDPALDARFRLLRQHGMSVNDRERHGSGTVIFEEHSVVGFNYRMTDIQAAVGREQLKRLDAIVDERRALAAEYDRLLADVPGVIVPAEPEWARSNWQSYLVGLPDGHDQRAVMQGLLDRGVASRRGIMCAHREVPYAGDHSLPVSERGQDRHIVLPLFAGMSLAEVGEVVDRFATVLVQDTPVLAGRAHGEAS